MKLHDLQPAPGSQSNGMRVALYVSYEATESEICDAEWTQIIQQLSARSPTQLVFN